MSMTKKDLLMKKLEEEKQADFLLQQYLNSGHRMPATRRDFLRSGVIAMASYMAAPTLIQLLSQPALAADSTVCPSTSVASGMPAFIHIQLEGGGALFANAIPRGNGGNELPNYSLMGMGSAPPTQLLFSNQAPFWVSSDASVPASELMRGVFKSVPLNSDIFSKTAFVAMAAESLDDRADNPQDISGMLSAAGLTGTMLPYLMTGSNLSNRFVGALLPSANLLNVASASSLEGSLGLKGSLGTTNLSIEKQKALVKAIEDLNSRQLASLENSTDTGKKTFRTLVNCGSQKNTNVVAGNSVVDIYNAGFPIAGVAGIWAKNYTADSVTNMTADSLNTVTSRTGQAVTTCLRGMSGATLLHYGGYDYHLGSSREFANHRDKFAGDMIGRILATAKLMNKAVFLYVSTDGSLSNADSSSATVNWSGDNPKRSMAYVFAYDPVNGAPPTEGVTVGSYSDAPFQLNHFSNAHVVENVNPLASLDAQTLAASAIFFNYLNFAGKQDLMNDPKLAAVKKRLTDALPVGGGSIANYFTRIKPRA
jgi:hypothetical protein